MKKQLLLLVMMLLPMVASADAVEINGIYYNLTSNPQTAEVTSNPNKYTGSIVIPDAINYNNKTYSVTSIGTSAFYGCSGLTSVTIPNSVTSIGTSAFYGCSGLTSITMESGNTKYDSRNDCNAIIETATNTLIAGCKNTVIPNSVTRIGDSAFSGCSGLTSVTIPNSVTSIGSSAFLFCTGLTSVTIPNSVTSIGNSAFFFCTGLTSVTIPNSVTSIGNSLFSDCSGLTSITIESGNTKYDSRNNCNAIIETATNTLIAGCKSTVIPDGVTRIEDDAFSGCSGLTSVTIPNSLISIGRNAFSGCSSLTSVTFPNSVTSIGNYAFSNCNGLSSVSIGKNMTSIGYDAFYGCTGLTSVTLNSNAIVSKTYTSSNNLKNIFGTQVKEYNIGDGVTSIGVSAFSNCFVLTSVSIGNSVTSIGNYAFEGCSWLPSVTIPNSVTSIGWNAFSSCSSLTSVTLNSNDIVSKTDNSNNMKRFFGDQVTEYILGDDVTSIGDYAFYGCTGLTSITIPNSVTSIGWYAFWDCSGLTSVTIPNSVTSIEWYAFWDCSSLTSVIIGNSVTSIGDRAFENCSALTSVTVLNPTPVAISSNTFSNRKNATLYVPQGSKEAYQTARYWKEFKEIIVTEETGINQIMNNLKTNATIITLDGKRINKHQKGLNIIGGKKIVVK